MLSTIFFSALLWLLSSLIFLADASPITRTRRAPFTLAAHDNTLISTVTALSATDITNLAPLTQLARAAYCEPETVLDWSCGGDRGM